jgi:ABC-type lipoprotein release transport system permease subunit
VLLNLKLSLKFLFSSKKKFNKFALFFTFLTIAISVASLLLSLSVFRGYKKILFQRYQDTYSDVYVVDSHHLISNLKESVTYLSDDKVKDLKYASFLELLISSDAGIKGVGAFTLEKGIFKNVINIKPYESKGKANCIFKGINSAAVGITVAESLNLKLGDKFKVIFAGINKKSVDFKVCSILDFGLHDLNSRIIYISNKTAFSLFPMAGFDSALKIKLKSGVNLKEYTKTLKEKLPLGVDVESWKDFNYSIFESIKLDKLVLSFILSILILVSCFNLVSLLFLYIKELENELTILHVLGLCKKRIINIFFTKALIVSIASFLFGIVLWFFTMFLINTYGIINIPEDIYLISKIPFSFSFVDVLKTFFITIIFTVFCSVFPIIKLFYKIKKHGVIYGFRSYKN